MLHWLLPVYMDGVVDIRMLGKSLSLVNTNSREQILVSCCKALVVVSDGRVRQLVEEFGCSQGGN